MCNKWTSFTADCLLIKEKDRAMRTKHTVNVLAIAGALVVLIGVTLAANDAFAAESAAIEPTASAIDDVSESTLAGAEAANTEAAADALSAVELSNRLDLDIQLVDHISFVLVGGL